MESEIVKSIRIKLSTIWNISNKINSTLDLNSLLLVIMESAKTMLECEGSALMLMDHQTNELKFDILTGEVSTGESASKMKSIRVPLGQGVAGIVAQTEKPLIVNDAVNDTRVFKKVDEVSKFSTRNLACVPMKIKDTLIGVLEVVNSVGRDELTKHDLVILNYLSDQAAIAIYNRQLFEELAEANKELANRVKELTALYEISLASMHSYDLNALFTTSVKSIADILNVGRCSLYIFDEETNKLVHYASVGIAELEKSKHQVDVDKGIMGQVFRDSYPILVTNIDEDQRFNVFKSEKYKTNSFLSIPLIVNNDAIGILNIADKKNKEVFNSTDLIICTSIGSQLASAYNTFKLNQELLEQERIKKELETAVAIQNRILPKSFENIGRVEIDAFTIPARNVGGDYYDFIRVDEHRFALIIADVSGKGIPAALFAALTRNTLRAECNNFTTTNNIFEKANKYICLDSEAGMFVTGALFLINHRDKTIHYSFAGHNDQIYFDNDTKSLNMLKSRGTPLGVLQKTYYEEKFMHYKDGDTLILYTDGVIEANNDKHEEFGEERFHQLIHKYSHLNSSDMLNSIREEVLSFSSKEHLFDDCTMLIVKF
jgi:sigma-B regulation protein RsbU (phosphoserine phosphatase)